MNFSLTGTWHQVMEVRGNTALIERIRLGICHITSSNDSLRLRADSVKYSTRVQSSMWSSQRVFQRDDQIDVVYEHQSLAEDGFGRGLMELSVYQEQNMLKGMFWDLAPGANRGWIRLYQTKDAADKYLQSLVGSELSNTSQKNSYASKSHRDSVDVFICYSHSDAKYLQRTSLFGFLTGLEKEGFRFWYDDVIRTSEDWDSSIKAKMEETDIAIVLVSQSFLNSRYCQDVEVARFIELREEEGMKIFPIILSDCDWEQHSWLKTTQVLPRNRRTIERHYRDRGRRSHLFKKILEELRSVGAEILSQKEQLS